MTIVQATLFRGPVEDDPWDTDSMWPAMGLGLAAWAALEEVNSFFTRSPDRRDLDFRRFYLARDIPEEVRTAPGFVPAEIGAALDETFWGDEDIRGDFQNTFEIRPLVAKARELIGEAATGSPLVVVTDVVLATIPKGFFKDRPQVPANIRYVLMTRFENNSYVISLARMDPAFWKEPATERIPTIKRRLRAAGCRATCEFLGLRNCTVDRCFLQTPILTPQALDHMDRLCDKHRNQGGADLVGYGFRPEGTAPVLADQLEPTGA